MDFQPVIDWVQHLYARYPAPSYVIAGVLLLVLIWKPFKVLKKVFLLLIMAGILYVCFYLLDSMTAGMDSKDKAIHRTEKAIEK